MSHAIKTTLYRFFDRVGRARVRRHLLAYSDRALADMGFSRQLLASGVDAWPWRVTSPPVSDSRQAIAELQAYSDAELNDLGLGRAGIEDAVYGGDAADRRLAA